VKQAMTNVSETALERNMAIPRVLEFVSVRYWSFLK
jgi:hypothetical protein